MSETPTPKYPTEFFLEFRSIDRFVYRVSDLYNLDELASADIVERLDNCHIYLLCKRARISLLPDSIQVTDATVRFEIEYKLEGIRHQADVEIPRRYFTPEECIFESSTYPHRELITRDSKGSVVGSLLLANLVHLMPNVQQKAQDLEVVYVGKGLRHSVNDRLENHTTLQRILAEVNSNEPDAEIFALAYQFKYLKNALAFQGIPSIISGDAVKQGRQRAINYRPSLDDQVSLIEASVISYFRPEQYNTHYLDFPDRKYQILKDVYAADFAAIVVQLDNTNIGSQRMYSKKVSSNSTHYIVVDFRVLEGNASFFSKKISPTEGHSYRIH